MALEVFGDRWSLLIVRDLLFKRRHTNRDFTDAEERIGTNVLADRLARLEAEGVLFKKHDPADARRVLYRLVPKELDLAPVLVERILWSARYERKAARPAQIREMTDHKARCIAAAKASSQEELAAIARVARASAILSVNRPRTQEEDESGAQTFGGRGPFAMLPRTRLAHMRFALIVVRGVLIFMGVGLAVATLVATLAVGPYALWVFHHGAPGAVILGAAQSVWLYLERLHWPSPTYLRRVGSLSGATLGLLNFAPSFAQTTVLHRWWGIGVFVVAALAGGYAAGRVNAWSIAREIGPEIRPRRPVNAKRLIAVGFVLLGVGVLEYSRYGPIIVRKLPVLALRESSVLNLPTGNAFGSRWSGTYQVELEAFESSGFIGNSGGQVELIQRDGQLTVKGFGGTILSGGIDANGRFWAGGQRQTAAESETLRFLLIGRFQDAEVFSCSERVTVLKNGEHVNSSREDGTGHRRR